MKEILTSVYYILAIIGIANSLLLCFILFLRKQGMLQANKLLALLFLSISIVLFCHLTMVWSKIISTPEHITLIYCLYLCAFSAMGPGLFLYLVTLETKYIAFPGLNYLHYLPVAIIFALYIIFIKNHDPIWNLLHFGILGQFLVYNILSTIHLIRITRSKIKTGSGLSSTDITWVSVIYVTFVLIWLIHLLVTIPLITFRIYWLQAILLTSLLYFVLISELFYNRIGKLHNYYVKYSSSRLTKPESEKYLQMIREFIEGRSAFRDPALTLSKISKELKISQNIISQVINEQLKQNFNDFLNSYRIGESKKMLEDPSGRHITIASIAYECGFNSLSAFNTAFKKFTKTTPSGYRAKFSIEIPPRQDKDLQKITPASHTSDSAE